MTTRLALGGLGLAAMIYALVGALGDAQVRPIGQGLTLIGAVLLHDAVLMPLVLAVGALLARFASPVIRPPIQAGLLASLAATVVAVPFVGGFGRSGDNPSVLPLNYGRGWLILLGVIWLIAGAWLGWRWLHRSPHGEQHMVEQ